MSQRRMFSPEIVESEEFLTMPDSSQNLYFHLGMNADDDGFIQPKIVMRKIGSNEDDLKVLLAKRFLLPFDSGVVVIKHWLIHNLIRLDRYKPTRFIEEKNRLFIKQNKAYSDHPQLGCQDDNQPAPQVRLGKVRLGKVNMIEAQAPQKSTDQIWDEMIAPLRQTTAPSTIVEFEDHWRAKNPNGKKELWQMKKVFDIKRRMATWKRNNAKWEAEKRAFKELKKVDEMPIHRAPVTSREDSGFSSLGSLFKKI